MLVTLTYIPYGAKELGDYDTDAMCIDVDDKDFQEGQSFIVVTRIEEREGVPS